MSKSTEALKQAHERLTHAVEAIVTGDDWQRMLKVASKFYRYSSGGITYSKFLNSIVMGPDGRNGPRPIL